jgi:YD repeat-containing protein
MNKSEFIFFNPNEQNAGIRTRRCRSRWKKWTARSGRRTNAMSRTTAYSYNAMGRTTLVDYPNDPDVSFTYDAFGNRLTMNDAAGTPA